MIEFNELEVGSIVYILDVDPISILELKLLSIGYDEDNNKRLRVANKDLSFEVEYDKLKDNIFLEEDEALAHATKLVFNETNKFIDEMTDGFIKDYFELDKAIQKYREIHPELFI